MKKAIVKGMFTFVALFVFLGVIGAGYAEAAFNVPPQHNDYMVPRAIALKENGIILPNLHDIEITGNTGRRTLQLVVLGFDDTWDPFKAIDAADYDAEEEDLAIGIVVDNSLLSVAPSGKQFIPRFDAGSPWPVASNEYLYNEITLAADNPPGDMAVRAKVEFTYSWDAGNYKEKVSLFVTIKPGPPYGSEGGGCGNTGVGLLGSLLLLLPVVAATRRRK